MVFSRAKIAFLRANAHLVFTGVDIINENNSEIRLKLLKDVNYMYFYSAASFELLLKCRRDEINTLRAYASMTTGNKMFYSSLWFLYISAVVLASAVAFVVINLSYLTTRT